MSDPQDSIPNLFDQEILVQNLCRATTLGHLPSFIDSIADEELIDKFTSISRTFVSIAIIAHDPSAISAAIKSSASANANLTCIYHVTNTGTFLDDPSLAPEAFDCIFVNGGLEWVNDLPGCLKRLQQALKPDGVMLAAMLGGETLHELRAAWLSAETLITDGASPRVAPFCDVRDAGSLLQRAGFALPVVDTDRLKARYDNAFALMKELKALGMSNALAEKRKAITTPSLLAAACAHYDAKYVDPDGRVHATFQLVYLTGWSPDASQPKPLRPGSAKLRLADALQVNERKLPRG